MALLSTNLLIEWSWMVLRASHIVYYLNLT